MTLRILEIDGPSPRRSESGAVVLEWWADLACPDCTDGLDVLDELRDRYGDRLAIRLRHLPLTMHVWAVAAAQCAVEAEVQGRGDEYAAAALRMIDSVDGPADYIELAASLGLDADDVAEALFDGRHARTVHDESEIARAAGLGSVPVFWVDGLQIDASATVEGSLELLVARVDRALA
ncbi:MAG TPA: thioredoxin domain-containing protein [Candidatus Nanopelagicales bacterium]|nr:thioredoxin domain-containing protein [Candidatus Nanopelagicales bacterium]